MARMSLWIFFTFAMLYGAGCGNGRPTLQKATGTLKLDGKPISGAQLELVRISDSNELSGRPSQAVTNDQGEFTPTTYDTADGIPPGEYRVGVTKKEMVGSIPADFNPENPQSSYQVRWVVPRKYADPATSGLILHVSTDGFEPDVFDIQTDGADSEVETIGKAQR